MAILKMSDGRSWILKDLLPTGQPSVDQYGKKQQECTALCLYPQEYHDLERHVFYMSDALKSAFKVPGLDRFSTYTVSYIVRDGKKSWSVVKGDVPAPPRAAEKPSKASELQDAIQTAYEVYKGVEGWMGDHGVQDGSFELSVMTMIFYVQGRQVPKREHNELNEPKKTEDEGW